MEERVVIAVTAAEEVVEAAIEVVEVMLMVEKEFIFISSNLSIYFFLVHLMMLY